MHELSKTIEILRQTPATLHSLLGGLSDSWVRSSEGDGTWSPFDVVGHLIHGEETDWIARVRIILEHGESRVFVPFDRFAQFERSKGKSLEGLLVRFAELRRQNLEILEALDLGPEHFGLRGKHPELGSVTLGQLLSTWAVHDLAHIAQITRVMARHYAGEVGPWRAYLRVLER